MSFHTSQNDVHEDGFDIEVVEYCPRRETKTTLGRVEQVSAALRLREAMATEEVAPGVLKAREEQMKNDAANALIDSVEMEPSLPSSFLEDAWPLSDDELADQTNMKGKAKAPLKQETDTDQSKKREGAPDSLLSTARQYFRSSLRQQGLQTENSREKETTTTAAAKDAPQVAATQSKQDVTEDQRSVRDGKAPMARRSQGSSTTRRRSLKGGKPLASDGNYTPTSGSQDTPTSESEDEEPPKPRLQRRPPPRRITSEEDFPLAFSSLRQNSAGHENACKYSCGLLSSTAHHILTGFKQLPHQPKLRSATKAAAKMIQKPIYRY